jgi:ADP-dependent NAD(P)H-hydrate dehydratase / NAD(P)H-hydrate epimerase
MKIFSAAQIRACDAYTIKASGIRPIELMERAALRCVNWITDHMPKDTLFVVLCGSGNNGGDGLAITRLLHRRGYGIKAFLLELGSERTPDCETNYQNLLALDRDLVATVAPGTFITDIPQNIVIIDTILGTGINRPVTGWLSTFIKQLNNLPNRKIAIDMPSGLSADNAPAAEDIIIRASDTLSFQFLKRVMLHPESAPFTGRVHIIDIGLDSTFINATHSHYNTIDREYITSIYKKRSDFSHKGTMGRVLIAGGEYGKIGAMVLSSKAALRAGAGLVTTILPECGYNILQTAVPEAMCQTSGSNTVEIISNWETADAIAIGPGLGTSPTAAKALSTFLESCTRPVVLDADALNIIAAHPDLLGKLPKGSVITPHPKEFGRIFGENTNSMVQVDHARIQAMRYNINIILKGHHTAVINSDGDCRYNTTGNAGMATGGAGDVLTGILTGLLAQGYAPYEAAVLSVYLHGLAGDLAAADLSQEALIAGDIIAYLGKAYLSL